MSPVVGTALLLALVVVLAAVVFVLVTGVGLSPPGPRVGTDAAIHSTYDDGTKSVYQYVDVESTVGDTVDTADLRLVVRADGTSYETDAQPERGAGTFAPGDTLTYNLSSMDLCDRGTDEVDVVLVHEPSHEVLTTRTVEIRRTVDLTVSGNTVTADTDYVATATLVGIGASAAGPGDTILPDVVNARVVLNATEPDRTVLTPWPDGDPADALAGAFAENVNSPGHPRTVTYSTGTLSKRKSLTVELRASKPNDWTSAGSATRTVHGTTYTVKRPDPAAGMQHFRYWVDTTDPSDGTIILLEDGDAVPTYGLAADHQRTLHEMLGSRIDGSGTLHLDDNEVVALYELSTPGATPAAAPPPGTGGNPDYNDAVAVIEVQPIPDGADSTSEDGVVYCT